MWCSLVIELAIRLKMPIKHFLMINSDRIWQAFLWLKNVIRSVKKMRNIILEKWQEVFWLACGVSFLSGCFVGWLM